MKNKLILKSRLNKNAIKFIQQQEKKSGNYVLVKKRVIDLTLTENPVGCPLLVKRTFQQLKINLSSYPKAQLKQKLQQQIADKFNIKGNSLVFGNGSEALIDFVCRTFLNQNDRVIIPETTTFLFKRAVILSGGNPVLIPMKADETTDLTKIKKVLATKPKLIFIANPNNPTGELLKKEVILEMVQNFNQTIFVIDEANIEFSSEKNSVIERAPILNNLIVLRSFSKGFGLAGLRIGYLITNKELIKIVTCVNQVFAVNSVALLAAKVALADKEFLRRTKKFSRNQRKFLISELVQLGFKVIPSQSNNLLVKITEAFKPANFYNKLQQAGVSVIPGSYFDGLDNSFFRVNIQTEIINQKFIAIIKKISNEEKDLKKNVLL